MQLDFKNKGDGGIKILSLPHLTVIFLLLTSFSPLACWCLSQTGNTSANKLQVFHPIVQIVTLPFIQLKNFKPELPLACLGLIPNPETVTVFGGRVKRRYFLWKPFSCSVGLRPSSPKRVEKSQPDNILQADTVPCSQRRGKLLAHSETLPWLALLLFQRGMGLPPPAQLY